MTDKILANLILLSEHVCEEAGIGEIANTPLADRISDLEEYLTVLQHARDLTFSSDDV